MVIVIKKGYNEQALQNFIDNLTKRQIKVEKIYGDRLMLSLIGAEDIDIDVVRACDFVDNVFRTNKPYFLSCRDGHKQDTYVNVGGRIFGGNNFQIIAGPCSVESEKQIIEIAKAVKSSGATLLRGGAFKPRSSPYSFQGLRGEGIELLVKAKKETGLPIVAEIMSVRHIDLFKDVDMVQIGARNMQNYELLKEVGLMKKPILLKRGFSNTIEEWLMSAEYLMAEGTKDIVLCERGIRTFENYTRNTLDISSVPILKEISHLPIIVDPSHASGISRLVKPLALASVGAGADGVMIEVHNDPANALCDGAQSVDPAQFEDITKNIYKILKAIKS